MDQSSQILRYLSMASHNNGLFEANELSSSTSTSTPTTAPAAVSIPASIPVSATLLSTASTHIFIPTTITVMPLPGQAAALDFDMTFGTLEDATGAGLSFPSNTLSSDNIDDALTSLLSADQDLPWDIPTSKQQQQQQHHHQTQPQSQSQPAIVFPIPNLMTAARFTTPELSPATSAYCTPAVQSIRSPLNFDSLGLEELGYQSGSSPSLDWNSSPSELDAFSNSQHSQESLELDYRIHLMSLGGVTATASTTATTSSMSAPVDFTLYPDIFTPTTALSNYDPDAILAAIVEESSPFESEIDYTPLHSTCTSPIMPPDCTDLFGGITRTLTMPVSVAYPTASIPTSSTAASSLGFPSMPTSSSTCRMRPGAQQAPPTVKRHRRRRRTSEEEARVMPEDGETNPDARPRFQCSVCQKTFSRPFNLRSHRATHLGVKPFVCTHKVKADHHREQDHDEENEEQEESRQQLHQDEEIDLHIDSTERICGWRFARRHDLERHVRSRHSAEKMFACKNCGAKCGRNDAFKRHLQRHAACGIAAAREKAEAEAEAAAAAAAVVNRNIL
ncbi:hypothetical protein BGW38_001176 [Lunasporangiospora selenospora]|uniref:C2H2-type domain-containing protein n=1 Tax=Lunasporangiospora selenospora TaxID=979761 RepID=A0A9P6FVZ6_9FUNG|nr:hypothetical protein BGW38_001176 [Lunasporangiospora selenospora]